MSDFVSDILKATPAVSGANGVGMSMYDDHVSGDDVSGMEDTISGLVSVGALTEVGAAQLRRKARRPGGAPGAAPSGGRLPSPPFAQSGRDTERRAPLGFTEDGTGAAFFSLPAVLGSTTTMRAKVSRVAHVDRLLIVPTAPGVVIESIKVGDEEQTLASGVSVELYGVTALTDTVPDNFSPIGPGLDFIVTLKNTTAGAITGTIGTKASCKR
jgi:hypothetical protein